MKRFLEERRNAGKKESDLLSVEEEQIEVAWKLRKQREEELFCEVFTLTEFTRL